HSCIQFGTQGYFAPEILAGDICSIKSDLYSLGIVLAEIITKCNFQASRIAFLSTALPGTDITFKHIQEWMNDVFTQTSSAPEENTHLFDFKDLTALNANPANCLAQADKHVQNIILGIIWHFTQVDIKKRPNGIGPLLSGLRKLMLQYTGFLTEHAALTQSQSAEGGAAVLFRKLSLSASQLAATGTHTPDSPRSFTRARAPSIVALDSKDTVTETLPSPRHT